MANPAPSLRAFHVDDETIYAAFSSAEAARLYLADTGEACEPGEYPKELTSVELDQPRTEFDEDERATGSTSSIRAWLAAQERPGFLCGSVR